MNREIREADRLATRPDVFDDDYVPRRAAGAAAAVRTNRAWNDADTLCVLARARWSTPPIFDHDV